jgi:DNA polymerase V
MNEQASKPQRYFALVDCNNFYVSCERVFDLTLRGRPVVVVCNNDGCIIARSNEAKALGIPMGAPLFQYNHVIKKEKIDVRSSNYALYGDISARVMKILEESTEEIEVYSIDEAFIEMTADSKLFEEAMALRKKILQWTGIPISIGIGRTKTLAKVANRLAKKSKENVFFLKEEAEESVLAELSVENIWGIGRRLSVFLETSGVTTALDLRRSCDTWVKKNMSVTGLRTVFELRGIPCLLSDDAPSAKKSVTSSRSFGRPVVSKLELGEALASYAARAGEKIREEGMLASYLSAFVVFHPYTTGIISARWIFPEPTSNTPELIFAAKEALLPLYKEGKPCRKAGVMLEGLVSSAAKQRDLFISHSKKGDRWEKTMSILDDFNKKVGYRAIRFASEGIEKPWKTRRAKCSPRYTTRWEEVLKIKI